MEKCEGCGQEIEPGRPHTNMRHCLTTITGTLEKVERRLTELENKGDPTDLRTQEVNKPEAPTASGRADEIK